MEHVFFRLWLCAEINLQFEEVAMAPVMVLRVDRVHDGRDMRGDYSGHYVHDCLTRCDTVCSGRQ